MALVRSPLDSECNNQLRSVLDREAELIALIKENNLSVKEAVKIDSFLIVAKRNTEETIQVSTICEFLTNLIKATREAKNIRLEEALNNSYSLYFMNPMKGFCCFDMVNKPNGTKPYYWLINFNIHLYDKLVVKVNYMLSVYGLSEAEAKKFNINIYSQKKGSHLSYIFPEFKEGASIELPNIQCDYVDQNDFNLEQKYFVLKAIQQRDVKGMLQEIYRLIIAARPSTLIKDVGLFATDEKSKPEVQQSAIFNLKPN